MKKGFTVIELLITFGIVAIAIVLVVSKVDYVSDASKIASLQEELGKLRKSIATYYSQTGENPDLVANYEALEKASSSRTTLSFKNFYTKDKMPYTPSFGQYEKSREVTGVDYVNKLATEVQGENNGGWNYDMNNGEIHADVEDNAFNCNIDWDGE